MRKFIDPSEISDGDLRDLIDKSYAHFRHSEVSPTTELDTMFQLELFHGPTYAFKDVALQFLGTLFEFILKRREQQMVILGATSGDTGASCNWQAIFTIGFRDVPGMFFILQ